MKIDDEALNAAVQAGGMPRMHTKSIIRAYLEHANKQLVIPSPVIPSPYSDYYNKPPSKVSNSTGLDPISPEAKFSQPTKHPDKPSMPSWAKDIGNGMWGGITPEQSAPGKDTHDLLQLAVDTGLEPSKVYTTQNTKEKYIVPIIENQNIINSHLIGCFIDRSTIDHATIEKSNIYESKILNSHIDESSQNKKSA